MQALGYETERLKNLVSCRVDQTHTERERDKHTSGCAARHGRPGKAPVAEAHVHLHASVTAKSIQIQTKNLEYITTSTATCRTDTEQPPFPPSIDFGIPPRTSTVGLPRLSKICLAFTDAIVTAISSSRDEATTSLSQNGKGPLALSRSVRALSRPPLESRGAGAAFVEEGSGGMGRGGAIWRRQISTR